MKLLFYFNELVSLKTKGKDHSKIDSTVVKYMPFPNWSMGGFFRTLQNAANKRYGAIDRNVFGGVLPGGSDSEYIGKSVNPKKVKKAQDFLKDYTILSATASALENAAGAANKAVNKLRTNPATQIPLSTIEKVQEFINPKLNSPITFTGFIDEPDAFWRDDNRVNVKGVVSDENRKRYLNDLGQYQDKLIKFYEVPWGSPESKQLMADINLPEPKLKNYANYSGPIMLHEFGHALNFADPSFAQKQRNLRYGTELQPGTISALSIGRSSGDEDRSLLQAGIEGIFGNVSAPGPRDTISEEALASRNALRMAKEFGLPKGRRLLGAALTTYVAPTMSRGFSEGIIGELASRGAETLADVATDYIVDPIMDKIRGNDYTEMEQKLRKYGYDESKNRLRQTGFGEPVQIEFK